MCLLWLPTRAPDEPVNLGGINCLPASDVAAAMARALVEQQHYFRFSHRLASGEVREVDVYSSPLMARKRPLLASVIHDVTDHHRTEDALEHATDTLRTLARAVEQSPVCTVITDPDGRIEYVNPKFCQMTGYSAAEAIGQNPRILKSSLTPPDEYAALWNTVSAGDTWSGTYANQKKTGETYWEQTTISPIRAPSGAITHFLAVKEDITDRRQTEVALRESERKYRMLFENMTAAFALHEMIYDEQGRPVDYRFLEVNPAFERLTGVAASALLGRTVKDVLPETEAYWFEVYGNVVATGEPISYQNYSRELGRHYDTFSFRPAAGQFAVVFTDVTQRVKAEEALQALAQESLVQAQAAQALAEATAALATALEPAQLRSGHPGADGPRGAVRHHAYLRIPGRRRRCRGRRRRAAPARRYERLPARRSRRTLPPGRGRGQIVSETRAAPGWRNIPPWTGLHEIRSFLLLPLIVHGDLYGCLRVASFTPGFYRQAHLQVASAFAERIAQSLWNARLYKLEQQRARAAEQLAAMRSDFLDAVSHELRTPLTTMLGYGELLQGHWDEMTDERRRGASIAWSMPRTVSISSSRICCV